MMSNRFSQMVDAAGPPIILSSTHICIESNDKISFNSPFDVTQRDKVAIFNTSSHSDHCGITPRWHFLWRTAQLLDIVPVDNTHHRNSVSVSFNAVDGHLFKILDNNYTKYQLSTMADGRKH